MRNALLRLWEPSWAHSQKSSNDLSVSDQCEHRNSSIEFSAQSLQSALLVLSTGATMKDPIPQNLPLSFTKILIHCTCQIYQLAATFLKYHIKRLNAIQPQHLLNPRHRSHANDPFENYPTQRSRLHPSNYRPPKLDGRVPRRARSVALTALPHPRDATRTPQRRPRRETPIPGARAHGQELFHAWQRDVAASQHFSMGFRFFPRNRRRRCSRSRG